MRLTFKQLDDIEKNYEDLIESYNPWHPQDCNIDSIRPECSCGEHRRLEKWRNSFAEFKKLIKELKTDTLCVE